MTQVDSKNKILVYTKAEVKLFIVSIEFYQKTSVLIGYYCRLIYGVEKVIEKRTIEISHTYMSVYDSHESSIEYQLLLELLNIMYGYKGNHFSTNHIEF